MVLHNVMLLVVGLLISILLQGSTPALILSKPYTVIVMLIPKITITLHACLYCYRFVFIQWNLYNEAGEVLLRTHKFHHLSGTVVTKS